ncbi:hypothetical protein ACWFRB_09295 [Rhodococcus sp. NPDC055112]
MADTAVYVEPGVDNSQLADIAARILDGSEVNVDVDDTAGEYAGYVVAVDLHVNDLNPRGADIVRKAAVTIRDAVTDELHVKAAVEDDLIAADLAARSSD